MSQLYLTLMKYPIIQGLQDEFKKSLRDTLTQIKLLNLPEEKHILSTQP